MRKSFWLLGLAALALFAFTRAPARRAAEDEVRERIEQSYLHGAFNEQNTEAMAAGFHPDFAIFSAKGKELARYELATWIQGIEARKKTPDYEPGRSAVEYRIPEIDVTGGAASAKVEILKGGELIYTDYLSLLRFESGWKIVAKVYHRHPSKEG